MRETDFPNLRSFYDYFSNRMEANERARFRYLASLGTAVTASAILIWQVINVFQESPSFWSFPTILSLVVLVYLMARYAESLLPMEELLQGMTEPGRQHFDERLKWRYVRENLSRLRADVSAIQVRDVLLSAAPMFAILILTFPASENGGGLALVIGVFRLSLAVALLALLLWTLRNEYIDAYLTSVERVEQLLELSPKFREMVLKLIGLGRVAGPLWKTVFYGVQIAAVFILVTFFWDDGWAVLRLALLLLALAFLGRFAYYIWKHIIELQLETSAWRLLRLGILAEDFASAAEVRAAARELEKVVIRARTFPYTVSDEVMEAVVSFPAGQDA